MVSLKDIARRCGVSVATVSKALNDLPDVNEETRARVRKTAAEIGYMTNAAARALKTNRTYNLGVLLADEYRSGLSHEYFTSLLDSFRVEAETQGYDTTFIHHNTQGRNTTYLQHCLHRGMDGLLIACVDFHAPQVRELAESDLPLVTIDHVFPGRLAVVSDNVQGLQELVRHVHSKGHRKIAFLHGENSAVTQSRLAGFHSACRELGLTIPAEYVRECVYRDQAACAHATRALLELPDPPTCILFPDDFSSIAGVHVLMEKGLRIPEDISIVGYNGIQLAQAMRLTSYSQNTAALGQAAARQLINLITHPEDTPKERILIPGSLLEGDSVKQI